MVVGRQILVEQQMSGHRHPPVGQPTLGLGHLMTDGMPVVTALPPSATPHRAGADRAAESDLRSAVPPA